MELSVLIVNYNTAVHLRNCLNSIFQFLNTEATEVIVVDNNSSDREIEKLPSEFPGAKFFFRADNDGFGSGCNFGARMASGKYLLFLNPDIILLDNSVIKLYEYLENDPDCGIVSGLMVDENRSVIYSFNDYPSLSWEFYHLIGYGYDQTIKKLVNKKEILSGSIFETDWFHGAVFMISKRDFDMNNGFNENYFLYYEDIEICYAIKMKWNKKIVCIPSVKVFHLTQSSLEDESKDNVFTFHIHRSKIIFLKNYFILKRSVLHLTGIMYVVTRIICLPFWNKYKDHKKEKLDQLLKVLKLYFSSSYVNSSKYKFIKQRDEKSIAYSK